MKKYLVLGVLFLAGLMSGQSHAWTYTITCYAVSVHVPSSVVPNANCDAVWVRENTPNDTFVEAGDWESGVLVNGTYSSPPIVQPQFDFPARTSPDETWIACGSPVPQEVELVMSGYLYRRGLHGSFPSHTYWVYEAIQALTSGQTVYVTAANPCT